MFTISHHHHSHKLTHLKSTLQELYIHIVIQALAISMISVFVPVFLLQQGFSLKAVFIFLFMEWAAFGLLAPLCGHIINRTGIKEVILIRTPMLIASLSLLALMPETAALQRFYLLTAFLLGFSGILYTLSISSLFAEIMHKKKAGHETGMVVSLPYIGTIIGPFIGGLISLLFGFPVLFIIVSAILLISMIPLMNIKRNIDHPAFEIHELFGQFSRYKDQVLFLNLYGIKGFVHYLVIPLLVFLYSRSALKLGAISSGISAISLLATIKAGDAVDRYGKAKLIRIGSAMAVVYFIILAITTHTQWFIYASLISGLFTILTGLPYESYLYEHAKKDASPVAFLVFKEMSLFMGRIVLFIFLIILAENMHLSFYLGGISSLLIGLNHL